MVSSVLLATKDKPEIKIDWLIVTKNPDKPLIIDVVIEGVTRDFDFCCLTRL